MQLAGLSMALGAFLAGLLLAETEYALQVESDIAPYKGLLMGLFFMTVGMEISVALFMEKWKAIVFAIVLLIGIATSVFTAVTFTRVLVSGWVRRTRPTDIHI